MTTTYGDISPAVAAKAAKQLLKRGQAYLCLDKFGQVKPFDPKSTKTQIFSRYEALDTTVNELQEGVTPDAKQLTRTDYPATIKQYGDLIEITDVVDDTHTDPVLMESVDILGQQSAEMLESVAFDILRAGTNVFYANGATRNAVNTAISLNLLRKVSRALKNQRARHLSRVLKSGVNYGSQAVEKAFICVCHTDLEHDIRNLPGFTKVADYGQMVPYEGEIGSVEDIRFITSPVYAPWEDAGGAKGAMKSNLGVNADVYPLLIIGEDAYGIMPFRGKDNAKVMVQNPNTPRGGDPLGQRGTVGWKAYRTACILNELWMCRIEAGVTDL